MTTTDKRGIVIKLPRKHAVDWLARYDGDDAMQVPSSPRTARVITLALSRYALCELISDALYYAEEMGPDNTGDVDYRPAARRCLAGIERAGVYYTRRGFRVTLHTPMSMEAVYDFVDWMEAGSLYDGTDDNER